MYYEVGEIVVERGLQNQESTPAIWKWSQPF
jgi:hypothetical protein